MTPRPREFDPAGKRVLVTGATGFIGRRMAARLLSLGSSVRVLARRPEKAQDLAARGAEVVQGDMTSPSSLRDAAAGCKGVVHAAGVLGDEFRPLGYYRAVNAEGTRALAEAAVDSGVERFLLVSTVAVYGFGAGPRTNERAPRRPGKDAYSSTKNDGQAAVEALAVSRGLPAVVVQPAQVYGPGDETWTLRPLRLLRAGKLVLPSRGRGLLQPIFVEDLVEGILAALERGKTGESYILCGPRTATVAEYFGHLSRMVGREHIRSVPLWAATGMATLFELASRLTGKPPAFNRSAVRFVSDFEAGFDGAKAKEELGFEARTTLEEGMEAVRLSLGHEG